MTKECECAAHSASECCCGAWDEPDYKALWKQMCERCDELDAKLAEQEPKREPLTDEQILEVARDHYNPNQRPEISFARAIEAAHDIIKNYPEKDNSKREWVDLTEDEVTEIIEKFYPRSYGMDAVVIAAQTKLRNKNA